MFVDRLSNDPADDPILVAIRDGVETRVTEFKESQPFDVLKWKLTKACMAMANLRDGGRIIIGCDERNGVPRPSGMPEEHQYSYDQDRLIELVNTYARPPVALTLRRVEFYGLRFVGIEVSPFERTPVMCINDNLSARPKPTETQVLMPGQIYVRSNARVSTTRVVTPDLLEEILENAAWKRAGDIIARAQEAGLRMPDSDAVQFKRERHEFGGLS
jgi:predicted HTH transcriptional regulator